jgi:hypothetical protein
LNSSLEVQQVMPAVHGWVEKSGVASLKEWTVNATTDRAQDFYVWRLNQCKAKRSYAEYDNPADRFKCNKAVHPPNTFPGCHVFVNHQ